MGSKQMPRRFTEREGAEFLGVRYQTLKNWRSENQAPPFYRIGSKIIYDESDLIQWMQARRITPDSVPQKETEVIA